MNSQQRDVPDRVFVKGWRYIEVLLRLVDTVSFSYITTTSIFNKSENAFRKHNPNLFLLNFCNNDAIFVIFVFVIPWQFGMLLSQFLLFYLQFMSDYLILYESSILKPTQILAITVVIIITMQRTQHLLLLSVIPLHTESKTMVTHVTQKHKQILILIIETDYLFFVFLIQKYQKYQLPWKLKT